MIETVLSFTADLDKGVQKTPLRSIFTTENNRANTFRIMPVRMGQPVTLTNERVTGFFIRYRDNATVTIQGSIVEGKASVTLSSACYAQRGMFSLAVVIEDGTSSNTVFLGEGSVSLVRTDMLVDEENIIPSLSDLLAQIDRMKEVTSAANAATQRANTSAQNADSKAQQAQAAATGANAASQRADLSAGNADTAALDATEAAERAGDAAVYIEGTTVSARKLAPGSNPTVQASTVGGHMHLEYGLVTGDKGEQGPGYTIKGPAYATVEALAASVTAPKEGDQYNVGVAPPYRIYRWTGLAWEDQGALQGPPGDDGAPGPGVAAGGTTGQVLTKASGADFDTRWQSTAPKNYEYGGRDLSTDFTAAELHAAVSAGDFTDIHVGDYWPVTLTGTYKDYGDGSTKSLNNAVIKYEVAGIGVYTAYGDNSVPDKSILFCPRDALPNTSRWRSANTTWTDTTVTNPWVGSALYATLNANDGLLPLIKATSIGAYMYTGPNGKGMRFIGETKASTAPDATSWAWVDRGCLFVPSEREVWGQDVWSEHQRGGGLALQWPIFAGSRRHISKGLGNGGSRTHWWCCDSTAGVTTSACIVASDGRPADNAASTTLAVVPCFLFV